MNSDLRTLIYGVNSHIVNPSLACLDDAEYWRLCDDGFRNERECLGDLQTLHGNASRICNSSGMLPVLPSRWAIGDTFFTALAGIAALIRKIAYCCPLVECLHDMADPRFALCCTHGRGALKPGSLVSTKKRWVTPR